MLSQKEQAALLKKALEAKPTEDATNAELEVIKEAKASLKQERVALEQTMQDAISAKGFLISVPNTEVILYETEDFQFLYCNNSEYPGKISFYQAFKRGAHIIGARTPITANGYVAKSMPKDQMNLILKEFQVLNNQLKGLKELNEDLEKEIAPLRYIDHLIKKHKEDTA